MCRLIIRCALRVTAFRTPSRELYWASQHLNASRVSRVFLVRMNCEITS